MTEATPQAPRTVITSVSLLQTGDTIIRQDGSPGTISSLSPTRDNLLRIGFTDPDQPTEFLRVVAMAHRVV